MFCPRCGIANLADQKFCRGCGHGLTGHRVALENNFNDLAGKVKDGATKLGLSAIGLIIITLMCLAVWLTQKDEGVFFTLIPMLAFTIPAAVIGLVQLNRVLRELSAPRGAERKAVELSDTVPIQWAAGAVTDPLSQSSKAPASVTEHTTLNLESPGPASGEPRAAREVDSPSSAS